MSKDPLEIIEKIDPKDRLARAQAPDGVDHRASIPAWFELDKDLNRSPRRCRRRCDTVVERIAENCEPGALHRVFMAGAGGRCAPA
jgi:hypothetical protein